MFIFVELFRLVGEQIGFEVLVFGPPGPEIEPGRFTVLSIFAFPNFPLVLKSQLFSNLEIFPPFLRNACDEIIW